MISYLEIFLKNIKTIGYLVIFISITFFISGCKDKYNDIPIPAYIYIDTFSLYGEKINGISDVWIYVNDNMAGVYELPAHFPIIAEGDTKIKIMAGIKVNGISASRIYYPFFTPFEKNITLSPANTTVVFPETGYYIETNILWKCNFENGIIFETPSYSDTSFIICNTSASEGKYSGKVILNDHNTFFETITSEIPYSYENKNTPLFAELNYKGSIPFEVGIYATDGNNFFEKNIILVNHSNEWKKIYIDINTPLSALNAITQYRVYLSAYNNSYTSNCELFIDNFKIVTK